MMHASSDKNDWMFGNDTDDPLRHAFDRKVTVHPGAMGRPVPPEDWQTVLQDRLDRRPGPEQRAVYINIPFCRRRCKFCNFYKYPADKETVRRYLDFLVREIEMSADSERVSSRPFNAVYIGGGTPTELTPKEIGKLLEAVNEHLPLTNDCEITFETRTSGLDDNRARACLEWGVNRFSVGVQSFNTEVRRSLGRIDEREVVIRKLNRLQDFGLAAVVIDLMFGLPGQSMEIWEDDVRTWLDLDLDGGDLYQLMVLRGSEMETMASGERGPADLPQQAAMFGRALDIMEDSGYRRLSVCHWGNGHRERSLYNGLTLAGAEVMPFGAGAGGTVADVSFMVESDLRKYEDGVMRGEKPLKFLARHHPMRGLFSDLSGQIDSGRVDMSSLRKHGVDLEAAAGPLLQRWSEIGLISRRGRFLELSVAGQFWNVNLAQGMIDWCMGSGQGTAGHPPQGAGAVMG